MEALRLELTGHFSPDQPVPVPDVLNDAMENEEEPSEELSLSPMERRDFRVRSAFVQCRTRRLDAFLTLYCAIRVERSVASTGKGSCPSVCKKKLPASMAIVMPSV